MYNKIADLQRLYEISHDDTIDLDGLFLLGEAKNSLWIYDPEYKDVCINTDNLGYLSLEELIASLSDSLSTYQIETTIILTRLYLDRELTPEERLKVNEAVNICKDALFDPVMERIVRTHIKCGIDWNTRIMRPVYLAVFMIDELPGFTRFLREVAACRLGSSDPFFLSDTDEDVNSTDVSCKITSFSEGKIQRRRKRGINKNDDTDT